VDETGNLERRLRELERTVGELATRVGRLERGAGAPEESAAAAFAVPGTPSEPVAPRSLAEEGLRGTPALAGRTFLVLGGAFVIRALTESKTLSAGLGVTLGILFALVWLVLADRAAARERHLSGAFHALAFALIVFPLVAEATTRFQLVAPPTAAAVLAAATGLGLAVAWRRAFRTVSWITEIGALVTGVALLFRARAVLPFVCFLLALAVASLLLAYGRGWRGQRWLVAIGLDLVVLLLGLLRIVPERPPEWLTLDAVVLAQVGLVVVYLGAFVLRLLVQGRFVTSFAVTQTVLVTLLGFEGALWLAGPAVRTGIGIASLIAAGVLHSVVARRHETRAGHGPAVAYFTSLATFLAAEAVRVLLPGWAFPEVWALAAVGVAALTVPGGRPVFRIHAALLSLAAALASGLLAASGDALATTADAAWRALDFPALVVLLLVAVATALLYAGVRKGRQPSAVAAVARAAALATTLVGCGGWVVALAASPLAGAPGEGADAGRLAVLRTAVLVAAAVLLAAVAGRVPAARELGRIATVVLGLGGLKLLAEDLRMGRAATLVFSLVLYGIALIVVPTLMRRGRLAKGPEAPA
jgi:hypothetical protein